MNNGEFLFGRPYNPQELAKAMRAARLALGFGKPVPSRAVLPKKPAALITPCFLRKQMKRAGSDPIQLRALLLSVILEIEGQVPDESLQHIEDRVVEFPLPRVTRPAR